MDIQAKRRLSGSLRTGLQKVQASDLGWIDMAIYKSQELEPAEQVVAQYTKKFVPKDRARFLLVDAVGFELRKRGVQVLPAQGFSEVFPGPELEGFADAVASFIESLPRPLEITCPFPAVGHLDQEIVISPELRIEPRVVRSVLVPSAARNVAVVRTEGIPTWMFADASVSQAFDHVRFVIGVWLAQGILEVDSIFSARLDFSRVKMQSYEILDLETEAVVSNESVEVSRRAEFISRMRFKKNMLKAMTGEDAPSQAAIQRIVASTVGPILSNPELKKEASGLLSASHWNFEAGLADDETTRFVFTCIGIDAIAGGGDPNQSLSQRIADRASYLLCRLPSERGRMTKRLLNIFKTRGKVVHGQVQKLIGDDLEVARDARIILTMLIQAELANLRKSARDSG